uniref:Exostosin GT47 domain-containing protein n=1 Tax=Manihot esculenta TaxID=3983 RepID=A0A2C9VN30_MANES
MKLISLLQYSTLSSLQKPPPPPHHRRINFPYMGLPPCMKAAKSSLEKIEEGLAKARAAIAEAIRSRNCTSSENNNDTFIPRGSVYLNPLAFHQSHIEMVKRFKVWTYKEGERPLAHEGPLNGVYSIEGHFISEIESDKSPFKAQVPGEACVFFLPLSVTSIGQYIYLPIRTMADYSRDRLRRVVTDYTGVIANKYPYWNRSKGADHFMVSCHDWAPDASLANPEIFKNFIRILCNANISEGFKLKRDIPIPEIFTTLEGLNPTNYGQGPKNRTILAFFEGRAHGFIREMLFKHWKNKDSEVVVRENFPEGLGYRKSMGRSKYCLCPSGYEVASPRVVDAIYQGCVPSILKGISNEKYLMMYRRVKQVERHFVLNRPAKPFDVTYMLLHSLWLRRLNFKA